MHEIGQGQQTGIKRTDDDRRTIRRDGQVRPPLHGFSAIMPQPFEVPGMMCLDVVYHVNDLIHPKEMAEIPAELVRHRPRTVGQHIFHLPVIHQMVQATAQIRAFILLFPRLPFAIEKHHVVRIALEEISPVFRIGIAAIPGILEDVHAFMEEYERIGIGMRVVPGMPALDGQHRGILFP